MAQTFSTEELFEDRKVFKTEELIEPKSVFSTDEVMGKTIFSTEELTEEPIQSERMRLLEGGKITPEEAYGTISEDRTPGWKKTLNEIFKTASKFIPETAQWMGAGASAFAGAPEAVPLVGGGARSLARGVVEANTQPLRQLFGIPYIYNPAYEERPVSTFGEGASQGLLELLRGATDVATAEIPVAAARTIPKFAGPSARALQRGELFNSNTLIERLSQREAENILPQTEKLSFEDELIPTDNPIQKIVQALKEAKPLRGEQEKLYSIERAKRAAKLSSAGEIGGEQGYFAQLGELKGELPKVQFEGIRNKISQPDIDGLFNQVEKANLLPYEKVTAKTGLSKLLGAEGGSLPTEGELKLLNEVFPNEFVQAVLEKRPLTSKLFQGAAEVLNVPRAVMASADLSAPLRQGIFLVGRPKQWAPAFKDMFKYAFNEKAYDGLIKDIKARPTYPLMRDSKLAITEIGGKLAAREEAFMSQLPEKIPVLGKVVRGSNRAYTGFLNKLRADTFDSLVKAAQEQGLDVSPGSKTLNDISKFVNSATGRGQLGPFESSAPILNSTFFSPRLMASRINLLNPRYYIKLDPFVRKEALKSLLSFTATGTTIAGLAKLGGADVGLDPRSADFGKVKIGNTRFDMWGGFQQYVRLASQLMTNTVISSTTGTEITLGEGYKPLTKLDIVGRFLQSKEAPLVSFATDWLKGTTFTGEKFSLKSEIAQRFVPMVAQDMYDTMKEQGYIKGAAMSVPSLFGIGTQTYTQTPTDIVRATNTLEKKIKELIKYGDTEKAKDLLNKNRELMLKGYTLKPTQENLNKIESLKDFVNKSKNIPSEKKKSVLISAEKLTDLLTRSQENLYKKIK